MKRVYLGMAVGAIVLGVGVFDVAYSKNKEIDLKKQIQSKKAAFIEENNKRTSFDGQTINTKSINNDSIDIVVKLENLNGQQGMDNLLDTLLQNEFPNLSPEKLEKMTPELRKIIGAPRNGTKGLEIKNLIVEYKWLKKDKSIELVKVKEDILLGNASSIDRFENREITTYEDESGIIKYYPYENAGVDKLCNEKLSIVGVNGSGEIEMRISYEK